MLKEDIEHLSKVLDVDNPRHPLILAVAYAIVASTVVGMIYLAMCS